MKLNDYEFGTDFQAMISHACHIAKMDGDKFGIDFGGINTSSFQLAMENGRVNHIWFHAVKGGKSFRCEVTEKGHGVFVWTDGRGWVVYVSEDAQPKAVTEVKHGAGRFIKTQIRVFCTTLGWDGKDYEGVGRWFPMWVYVDEAGKRSGSYIRLYERKHKCYCFLKLTNRLSKNATRIAECDCIID